VLVQQAREAGVCSTTAKSSGLWAQLVVTVAGILKLAVPRGAAAAASQHDALFTAVRSAVNSYSTNCSQSSAYVREPKPVWNSESNIKTKGADFDEEMKKHAAACYVYAQ
jgi:hypothetical protein